MIVIDKMCIEDVEQTAAMEQIVFSQPWSKQSFLDTLENEDSYYLVAREGSKVVGYIGLWKSFEEGELTNVAVLPTKRRQGIATKLLEEIKCLAKKEHISALTLEVRYSNEPAIRLYENQGFKTIGIRPGYYEYPKEDAMIMWNYSL